VCTVFGNVPPLLGVSVSLVLSYLCVSFEGSANWFIIKTAIHLSFFILTFSFSFTLQRPLGVLQSIDAHFFHFFLLWWMCRPTVKRELISCGVKYYLGGGGVSSTGGVMGLCL